MASWASQVTKAETQEVGPRVRRSVAESLKMESAAERGPVKTLRNGRGRGVGPVACARGCSGLARLDTVYLIGPSILTCRHADMPTCRHADMPTCWITGLFGTASERQILMAGVRGRLEKGRQVPPASARPDRQPGIRRAHLVPATVKDSARDRDPLPLFPRGETLPGVESHHPDHPAASRQAGKQASRDKAAPP